MEQYQLSNKAGLAVCVIALGATIVSLKTPDRDGNFADIVLGFDNEQQYLTDSPYFGTIVGRYGNRIAKGQFSLGSRSYQLAMNNDGHHLHGGDIGFDKQTWQVLDSNAHNITLRLVSPDGDEGYPGELTTTVNYSLDDNNRLTVTYQATTTKPTVINLTQHSYFNLAGHNAGSVLDHELTINGDRYVEIDQALIPSGNLPSVKSTPFDFRRTAKIGARINEPHEQLINGSGYDHTWVLNKGTSSCNEPAARLRDPSSGRTLTIYTEEPGIQFYSGNFLESGFTGKNGAVYGYRDAIALETQHFPDSPNQPSFPSTRLDPDKQYHTRTIFEFAVEA